MSSVKKRSLWPSAATIALCVGLAAATLVLMLYHGAYLSNAWPLLLVLLCLGLHFFITGAAVMVRLARGKIGESPTRDRLRLSPPVA